MTVNPALDTVLTYLRSLAVQTTQIGADINVRREFIDRYFAADPSILACEEAFRSAAVTTWALTV